MCAGPAASLFTQCPCRYRLFVCCCGQCLCVHLRGEPTLFPGWCANKKLCYTYSYSNLWLVTLHPCFQPVSLIPHTTPLQNNTKETDLHASSTWPNIQHKAQAENLHTKHTKTNYQHLKCTSQQIHPHTPHVLSPFLCCAYLNIFPPLRTGQTK